MKKLTLLADKIANAAHDALVDVFGPIEAGPLDLGDGWYSDPPDGWWENFVNVLFFTIETELEDTLVEKEKGGTESE